MSCWAYYDEVKKLHKGWHQPLYFFVKAIHYLVDSKKGMVSRKKVLRCNK